MLQWMVAKAINSAMGIPRWAHRRRCLDRAAHFGDRAEITSMCELDCLVQADCDL
jgi:hypothetical protein